MMAPVWEQRQVQAVNLMEPGVFRVFPLLQNVRVVEVAQSILRRDELESPDWDKMQEAEAHNELRRSVPPKFLEARLHREDIRRQWISYNETFALGRIGGIVGHLPVRQGAIAPAQARSLPKFECLLRRQLLVELNSKTRLVRH